MRYGSITNNIMAGTVVHRDGVPIVPEVGMGATWLGWTDRDPYTVIEVRANKHGVITEIVLQEDNGERADKNGMSESQRWVFTRNPNGAKYIATLRKNGAWIEKGCSMKQGAQFLIGERQKYYDYSF